MTPDLEQKLRSKYPLLLNKDPEMSLEDGWYQLVDDLFDTIAHHVQNTYPEELHGQFTVEQLKEKFSGLRCYMDHSDDFINGAIYMAETQSFRICEQCGNKGKRTKIGGWLRTLCQDDENKMMVDLERQYKEKK